MTYGITLTSIWDGWSTEEKVKAVRRLWVAGHSASYIRDALGARSRNVIIGLVHRHIKGAARHASPSHSRPERLGRPLIARLRPPRPRAAPRPLARPRKPEAPTLIPPPAEGSVAFLDRHSGQCVFPYGEASERMLVCGEPIQDGRPYCSAHCRVAYVPIKSDGRLRNNHFGLKAR